MKKTILLLTLIFLVKLSYAQDQKEYYDNGELKSIGKYNSDGKKIGEWKTFHENGQLKTIGKYANIYVGEYTNDCEEKIQGAAKYYKKEMEGITGKGYARVEYDFEEMRLSNTYNYVGLSVDTAKLAVAEYGDFPVLINQKYDSNGQLNGVDVLIFKSYRDLVFIIEPLVQEACKGTYEIQMAGDDIFLNETLYTRDKKTAYDLDSVNMKTVFIYKLEWNNVKNGEWKHYDENGSLVKTENYLNDTE